MKIENFTSDNRAGNRLYLPELSFRLIYLFLLVENMSESCGSNAFPYAEGEKQKANKKRTREVEDESSSTTTQQPYKMSEPSHWQETQKICDSQPVLETQKFCDSQPVLETQFTQELFEKSPWLGTQELYEQSPEEQFGGRYLEKRTEPYHHVVDPNTQLLIDTYAEMVDLDHSNVLLIVEMAIKLRFEIGLTKIVSWHEGELIADKINNAEGKKVKGKKVEVSARQVQDVLQGLKSKFKNYCTLMAQGVRGLKFDFEDGTFKATKHGEDVD